MKQARIARVLWVLVVWAAVSCGGGSNNTSSNNSPGTPIPGGNGGVPASGTEVLFATAANANSIDAWSIDAASGALTLVNGAPFPSTGQQPRGLAVHSSNNFLYVVDLGSAGIAPYSIANLNGALPPLEGEVNSGLGSGPLRIALDTTGTRAYVASVATPDAASFSIDPSSGRVLPLNSLPFNFQPHQQTQDLAVVPPMVYLSYSVGIWGNRLNSDGSLNPGSSVAQTASPLNRLAVTSGGHFLYACTAPTQIGVSAVNDPGHIMGWQVNADGTLTSIITPVSLDGVQDIVVSGSMLLASSPTGITVYTIGPVGSLTLKSQTPVPGGGQIGDLIVDQSGRFVYVAIGEQVAGFALGTDATLTSVVGSPFTTNGVQPFAFALSMHP